jgi:4-hydroxybenzoate polyprenyltransferase
LTKRFTSYSHFFLGLALSVSPVGAWLAVRGHFDFPPLILAAAVVLWVAGFDLIYATQDVDFDRAAGLHSLVVRLGVRRTLTVAQALHAAMWILLALFGWSAGLGKGFAVGLALILPALVYELAKWMSRPSTSPSFKVTRSSVWSLSPQSWRTRC